MKLSAHGISATLPDRWEGAIARRDEAGVAASGVAEAEEQVLPTAHLSTVPLPADRGDFGSGAVEDLGPDDLFVALVEFGGECLGTALYSRQGMPRRATSRRFGRRSLQRTIAGQAGWQTFFTEGGRAFCLYVVLGRDHDVEPLLRELHVILASIEIEPA